MTSNENKITNTESQEEENELTKWDFQNTN